MNSGAPTFGTPEAAHITYGAGQLARRLGLPYRSGGAFCGSKLPDAQAAYETANSLNMALLAGVNFMLHACGWLEGGLVSSYEKFVMDADQLGTLHHLAQGHHHGRERPGDGRDPRGRARAATTSAATIPRPTSRRPSGGRTCSTTSPSRPGTRKARATPQALAAERVTKHAGRLPGPGAGRGHRARRCDDFVARKQGLDARRLHLSSERQGGAVDRPFPRSGRSRGSRRASAMSAISTSICRVRLNRLASPAQRICFQPFLFRSAAGGTVSVGRGGAASPISRRRSRSRR